MTATSIVNDALAALEAAFVDDYLRGRGYSRETLSELPRRAAERILAEAEAEASVLLAQIEARTRLLRELDEGDSK